MREGRHGIGQGDPSDHDAATSRSQPPSGRHHHTRQKRPGPHTCGAQSLPEAALEECRLFSKPRWHLKLLRARGWQPEAHLQPPGKSCLAFPRPPLSTACSLGVFICHQEIRGWGTTGQLEPPPTLETVAPPLPADVWMQSSQTAGGSCCWCITSWSPSNTPSPWETGSPVEP